ncbi:arsenic transporter [Chitinophaga sp. MD30]|nr:arsenic transporter [Chitinophaga sp. MD30]
MPSCFFVYAIVILATAGVIIRPFKLPEFVWAVGGAILLVVSGLINPSTAWLGVTKGIDVYLFLTGMMLLAESAREEGLFDWLACHATKVSHGSGIKLFILVYIVGLVITAFMSNDATAVVLTPAVAAAMQRAKVRAPLPYLYICAFVANAASFILPISNPANLVIYGRHMPPLLAWLKLYALPSLCAVILTFVILFLTQKKAIRQPVADNIRELPLSKGARIAFAGIIGTIVVLLLASLKDWQLGLPTASAGIVTASIVMITGKKSPFKLIGNISWAILPLVAGLFVLVEALSQMGFVEGISHLLQAYAQRSPAVTGWVSGTTIAIGSNLVNNLPAGLIAGSAVATNHLPAIVKACVLIGIDLGPNLSVTGSLATILWLTELRRCGLKVSAWQFLKLGVLVMLPALFAALAALWI